MTKYSLSSACTTVRRLITYNNYRSCFRCNQRVGYQAIVLLSQMCVITRMLTTLHQIFVVCSLTFLVGEIATLVIAKMPLPGAKEVASSTGNFSSRHQILRIGAGPFAPAAVLPKRLIRELSPRKVRLRQFAASSRCLVSKTGPPLTPHHVQFAR